MLNATKKDLLRAIREHCEGCSHCPRKVEKCYKTRCKLFPYRMELSKQPDQTHLFRVCNFEDFAAALTLEAGMMGRPFFWSELRAKMRSRPLNDNWWGAASRVMKGRGYFVVEGHQSSAIKSRHGAQDKKWSHPSFYH